VATFTTKQAKLELKAGENRGLIIEAKQEKLKNDLVVISPDSQSLAIPLGKLNTAPYVRQTKKGQFIYNYSFKDLKDKIDIIKKRSEMKEKNIIVFSPICPELKKLHVAATDLKEKGRLSKVWFYRDQLYAQHVNGDRYSVKSEVDIDFLDS